MPAIQTTTFKIPTNQTSANEFDVILLMKEYEGTTSIMRSYYKISNGWSVFGDSIYVSSADFEDGVCTIVLSHVGAHNLLKVAYIPGPLTSSGGGN